MPSEMKAWADKFDMKLDLNQAIKNELPIGIKFVQFVLLSMDFSIQKSMHKYLKTLAVRFVLNGGNFT